MFQLWLKPLISFSVVRRHVFLGLGRVRLPSGVKYCAVLVMDSFSFLGDGFIFLSDDVANPTLAPFTCGANMRTWKQLVKEQPYFRK